MNDFRFSDLERAAFARITHENEARRIEAEMKQREKAEEGREFINKLVEANREEIAEREQKANEAAFLAEAEMAFFKANPTATESDFKRLLPKIKDEFMLDNFRGIVQANAPEWFGSEMN